MNGKTFINQNVDFLNESLRDTFYVENNDDFIHDISNSSY